jgi:hypothetical protein
MQYEENKTKLHFGQTYLVTTKRYITDSSVTFGRLN